MKILKYGLLAFGCMMLAGEVLWRVGEMEYAADLYRESYLAQMDY